MGDATSDPTSPASGKAGGRHSYADLDQGGKVIAEYIWIGGSGQDIRCKARSLDGPVSSPSELPEWNFDGSSTGQAPGHDSEVIIKPRAIFPDPFRGGDNILVLCDCYTPAGEPLPSNTRYPAAKVFSDPKVSETIPWFGLEQEYTLFKSDGRTVIGWPKGGYPQPQGPYYCAVGADRVFGRAVVEAHYKACLYAGVKISGVNAEVMPGQWEFQVGPCEGISQGDHMWIARYILNRVAEEFGLIVSIDPKPIPGDWNGAGMHTNYSTEAMRSEGGYAKILEAIKLLEKKHFEHIKVYGEGNERRLTGKHETANMNQFSYGVANRGASIRIPRQAEAEGKGYFEDRRPASNADPYVITMMIAKTTLLEA
jgi:glutamine synthetase